MQSIFYNLIGVSITVSLMVILLLLLASYLKERYAVKLRYFIWMLLAVRLLIPVDFGLTPPPVEFNLNDREIAFGSSNPVVATAENTGIPSNGSEARNSADIASTSVNAGGYGSTGNSRDGSAGNSNPNQSYDPGRAAETTLSVSRLLLSVYLAGTAAFMFWQFGLYLSFRRSAGRWCREPSDGKIPVIFERLKSEEGIGKPIRIKICRKISSPVITGLIRPVLLLPHEDYERVDLEIILRHELVHFKRGDLGFKLLLICANAFHWFNPIIYAMVREANRDIEISCDEEVLKGADLHTRKRYGERILELTLGNRRQEVPVSTNFYSGKGMLKSRLEHIFDEREKKRGGWLFCAVLAVILLFSACRFDMGLNRWQIDRVSSVTAEAYGWDGSGLRNTAMGNVDARLSFDLDHDGIEETEFVLAVMEGGGSCYLEYKGNDRHTVRKQVLKGVEPGTDYSLQAANLENGASIMFLIGVSYRSMPFDSGYWELYSWDGSDFERLELKTLEENLQLRIMESGEIQENALAAEAEIYLYDRATYAPGSPAAALYFRDGLKKGEDFAPDRVYYASMSEYDAEGYRTWGQDAISKIMTEMNFISGENVKGLDDPPPVLLETRETVFITLPNITAEVRQYYQYRDGRWNSVYKIVE